MAAAQPELENLAPGRPIDPLLGCLHLITRLYGRPISETALAAGMPVAGASFDVDDYVRAAGEHGYSAQPVRRRLNRIPALLLPATLLLESGGACVLTRFLADDRVEVIFPESGLLAREVPRAELEAGYRGQVLFTQPDGETAVSSGTEPVIKSRRSWFWGTLAAYTPYYIEAAVAGLLVNVLAIATALYIMNVYDRVVPNNAFETLLVLAIGTAVAVGFEFCARSLRAYFLDAAGRKADLVLGSRIFAQALGIELGARPASTGAFAAQLREFEAVRDFITSATLTAVMDLPFVAFFIFVVALIGGPIYLVPLTAVPVVLLVGLLAQWPLARAIRQNMQESAVRHGLLVESIENAEAVKTMRAEGLLRARYERSAAAAGRSANRARQVSALVINFTTTTLQLVTVGMVFWGVYLIAEGRLTVGALVACVILIGRGMAPLQQFAALMTRYQQARTAYFTLQGLMAQRPERDPRARYTPLDDVAGAVSMQDVEFAYPESKLACLKDVSFGIEPGEHVGILGRVGSGKSTLLRLIAGLYPPSAGVVRLEGLDIEQLDPADLRRHIGYVAQEPHLFNGSLRDNIALGDPQADDASVMAAARIAGLEPLIANHPAGLHLGVGERGRALSGGQRQAVACARALLLVAPVLLLDEPTSAMDHNMEQRFVEEMRRFAAGRTLLLVTHKPSMLALVDRVLVVDGGRIALDGPRDEVLRALSAPRDTQ